jgi:hypothetical protein
MMSKMATFMVCGWFLLKSTKDDYMESTPQDNMCHHVSGMEHLAY